MSVSLRSFTTIQRGKGERGRKSIELASSANVRTNTMLAFSPTKKEMEKEKKTDGGCGIPCLPTTCHALQSLQARRNI